MFERLISRNRKPFVLDLAPQDLDQIELRAIRRKKQQIEPLLFPALNSRFERRALVNGRVVEDDQRRLLHSLAVVIKTLDQDLAIDRALKDVGLKRSVQVENAQEVESLRMNALNFQGLSAKLPGVGNARDQTEADPVEIDQVEITIRGSAGGPQLIQMRFGGSKIPLFRLPREERRIRFQT